MKGWSLSDMPQCIVKRHILRFCRNPGLIPHERSRLRDL